MQYLSLVGWVVLCEGIGIIGGIASSKSVGTWYQSLRKPSFNPPAGAFAPVWTILYLLMALSAWIACSEPQSGVAASIFIVQLSLNFMWSMVFFRYRNPRLALAALLALDIAIVLTMGIFFAFSAMAGWLMLPYLTWCLFATFLNEEIVRLNPRV